MFDLITVRSHAVRVRACEYRACLFQQNAGTTTSYALERDNKEGQTWLILPAIQVARHCLIASIFCGLRFTRHRSPLSCLPLSMDSGVDFILNVGVAKCLRILLQWGLNKQDPSPPPPPPPPPHTHTHTHTPTTLTPATSPHPSI